MPRALVVDDDDSIREITQLALEVVAGWEVVTADSGARAIELAAEHQPDVVVLDMMMPDMDGLTTFRHLQEQASTAHVPVVLLTAKVQVGDRQLWDEMAVAGVISKPFDPMTLAAEISTMLGWA
ncbi:response regulator [Nocardioides sp. SOB77]|uniref:Response regulator n=1 Tax=Nocardioides oceani TaxID=3058369 RepID=A0ABT8FLD6_9ACTN|nr:response regulator [Nocardioides oceani]MDN4175492.1 response regulator [Nocardioides oceani]